MSQYLNKKIRAAIDQGKPLRWEFGKYAKYYTGLKLFAYTGYAETGRIYEQMIFAVLAIDVASDLCIELNNLNVTYADWDKACEDYHRHHRSRPQR